MPQLELFLIAHSYSVDQTTNRLSVFQVLDDLRPRGFPSMLYHLVAVSAWHMNPEDKGRDFQASVVLRRPDGQTAGRYDLNFSGDSAGARIFLDIVGTLLDVPGRYVFELLLNGNHAATHTLIVHEPVEGKGDDDIVVFLGEDAPTTEAAGIQT